MKAKLTFTFFILTASVTLVISQPISERIAQGYYPTTPPPLALQEAYQLALTALGAGTNRFYCVSTTCLKRLPTISNRAGLHDGQGWTFEFSSTNGVQKHVAVYFDKATTIDGGGSRGGF